MCDCGCTYERYPRGIDGDCLCTKPRGLPCPMDDPDDDDPYEQDDPRETQMMYDEEYE